MARSPLTAEIQGVSCRYVPLDDDSERSEGPCGSEGHPNHPEGVSGEWDVVSDRQLAGDVGDAQSVRSSWEPDCRLAAVSEVRGVPRGVAGVPKEPFHVRGFRSGVPRIEATPRRGLPPGLPWPAYASRLGQVATTAATW